MKENKRGWGFWQVTPSHFFPSSYPRRKTQPCVKQLRFKWWWQCKILYTTELFRLGLRLIGLPFIRHKARSRCERCVGLSLTDGVTARGFWVVLTSERHCFIPDSNYLQQVFALFLVSVSSWKYFLAVKSTICCWCGRKTCKKAFFACYPGIVCVSERASCPLI